MATKKTGFSLSPSAQVASSTIGLGSGRAKVVKAKWGMLKYSGAQVGKKAVALLITWARGGEKVQEAYTVGKGFLPSSDGKQLEAKDNQTGLNPGSKCGLFFKSLEDHAQMPADFDLDTDINVLAGLDVDLIKKPMEKGEGMSGNPTVLIVDDVHAAPWKIKGGSKKKADADDDDDEEEADDADSDDDDDEDDAPKKKGKSSRDDDDDEDEDEDEKPVKKGKGKPAADDDDDDDADTDDDADEDIDEQAGEALIDALDDGPLKLAKIEAAVLAKVKKHKNGKAIAARAASSKFLKSEKGWTWDGKTAQLE